MTESRFNWGIIFWLFYVVVGLVQFNATYDGLRYWLGWHWLVLVPMAFIVGYIPLLGSIAGMVGAHLIWRWEILPSFSLFFWYVPLYVGFLVTAYVFQSSEKESNAVTISSKELEMTMPHANSSTIVVTGKRNIFIRAFTGDLQLSVTYWIFGMIILNSAEIIINFSFGEKAVHFWTYFVHNYGLVSFQAIAITLSLLVIIYKIAIIHGIWVSANKYAGPKVWSVLAKFFMVIWAINIVPEFLGMSEILKLEDPLAMAAPNSSLDMYSKMVRNLLN